MIFESFDYKRKSIPICVYNPWFDRRGQLYDHISEYGDIPADRLPYMVPSPASDDPEIVAHSFGEHIHKELELTFIVTGEWRVCINGFDFDVFLGIFILLTRLRSTAGIRLTAGIRNIISLSSRIWLISRGSCRRSGR